MGALCMQVCVTTVFAFMALESLQLHGVLTNCDSEFYSQKKNFLIGWGSSAAIALCSVPFLQHYPSAYS